MLRSGSGGPVLDGAPAAPSVVGSQQPRLWTASGVKAATPGSMLTGHLP